MTDKTKKIINIVSLIAAIITFLLMILLPWDYDGIGSSIIFGEDVDGGYVAVYIMLFIALEGFFITNYIKY